MLLESHIGWIFKSKANESYCIYDSGPMVRHYEVSQQIQEHMEAILTDRDLYWFSTLWLSRMKLIFILKNLKLAGFLNPKPLNVTF